MAGRRDLLLEIESLIEEDPRIRAAVLQGSRADPRAELDALSDYDVALFVRELEDFARDRSFLDRFGPVLLLQTPEEMDEPPPLGDGRVVYLVQFADGDRLDLTLHSAEAHSTRDSRPPLLESMTRVLVDRDGMLADLPEPSDADFRPTPPTVKAFDDCCNELWWVSLQVAKALWRRQLVHAKSLIEGPLRAQLMRMLLWCFGVRTGFARASDKGGRRLREVLGPDLDEELVATYAGADFDDLWASLDAIGRLFGACGREVAAALELAYPEDVEAHVAARLAHVRRMSRTEE